MFAYSSKPLSKKFDTLVDTFTNHFSLPGFEKIHDIDTFPVWWRTVCAHLLPIFLCCLPSFTSFLSFLHNVHDTQYFFYNSTKLVSITSSSWSLGLCSVPNCHWGGSKRTAATARYPTVRTYERGFGDRGWYARIVQYDYTTVDIL
jgi:hypothetical protein